MRCAAGRFGPYLMRWCASSSQAVTTDITPLFQSIRHNRDSASTRARGEPWGFPQASPLLPINNGNDSSWSASAITGNSGTLQCGAGGRAGECRDAGGIIAVIVTVVVAYNTNNSTALPNALFSHSDQAGQWQTSIPTGLGSTGWGGRIADMMQSSNTGATFPAMTSTNEARNLFPDRAQQTCL